CSLPDTRPFPTRRSSDLSYENWVEIREGRCVFSAKIVTLSVDLLFLQESLDFSAVWLMKDVQQIKQRFGIIGSSYGLNRAIDIRSEEHTSELQSREKLVC